VQVSSKMLWILMKAGMPVRRRYIVSPQVKSHNLVTNVLHFFQ